MPADQGVRGSDMSDEQKKALLAVIREFASNGRSEIAAEPLRKIAEAVDSLQFAWAGGLEKGDPHYFRVVGGNTFLIEYANTQNNANHAHAVWRLFDGDFGRDILREHLETAHKGVASLSADRTTWPN